VFNTASDGSLTEVANSPFGISNPQASPQASPQAVAVSPNGSYIYVASTVPANSSGENVVPPSTIVDEFAVGSGGSLTLTTTYPFSAIVACDNTTPALLTPVQFYIHPTQKFLYLFMQSSYGPPCSGQPSEVQAFTINSDGTLTPGTLDILPLYATYGYALTGTPDGSLLFLTTKINPNYGFIYQSSVNPATGDINFGLVYSSTDFQEPILSPGGLAVDSTSSYLYSSAGSFRIQDGALTAIDDSTNPFTGGGSLFASPTLPLLFGVVLAPVNQIGPFYSEVVNSDGSLTPAPGSPYNFSSTGILSGTTPIPTKAVMWVRPDTAIDISSVVVGQTGTGGSTIQNVGYGPLTVSSVTLTGDPSLTVINTCTSPVAPGGSCGVGATFAPTSAGTFTGTLTIVSSVGTRTLSISATSVAPYSNPTFLGPQPLLFPDTATGSSSPLTVTLANYTGATGPLTVSSLSITGSNAGDYSQTNNCLDVSIPVGGSCTITVTFTPQALGSRVAALTALTNEPNDPSGIALSLTGNGLTTVTKYAFNLSVSGPGTVTQTPTGNSLPNNTTITVAATPNANATFTNWTGGICVNEGNVTPCTFVLNKALNVTANFAAYVNLTTAVVGAGSIQQSPSGTSFPVGTAITLTAVPNPGATFQNWSPTGVCYPGTPSNECEFDLNANTTVTANFTPQNNWTLATTAIGPGTITQSPTGTSFPPNTAITLTAVPNTGATFTSWSGGACSGSTSTTCTFNISANTSVTATFASPPAITTPTPSKSGAPGSAFTFALSASGFTVAPTYTASCAIPEGTCTVSGSTLTVTTTAGTSGAVRQLGAALLPPSSGGDGERPRAAFRVLCVSLAAMLTLLLGTFAMRRGASTRHARLAFAPLAMFAMLGALALLAACGGGGGGGGGQTGTPAGTYVVTIKATAGTQTATTTVSVVVQ
jgi:hypothetical protein